MNSELQQVVTSLESAQERLRRLDGRLSEQDWRQRPEPNAWSAIECVEHLNITSRAYIPRLRDALAEARNLHTSQSKTYRRDFLGALFGALVGPMRQVGRFRIGKVNTSSEFVPRGKCSNEEILSDFLRLQAELLTIARSSDGLPIDRVKIRSPFGEKISYNAYSALVILHRHEHRHLDQAEIAAKK